MSNRIIDLRSDTKTAPTAAMRAAMAVAEVGDEQLGEDPSVNQLCAKVCELLDKEAAVFLPSGTMCNQIAVGVFCRPGDEVIADVTSHLLNLEAGGAACVAGAQVRAVQGAAGLFSVAAVEQARKGYGGYASPNVRLITVEQTANLGGGTIWPVTLLSDLASYARQHRISMHLDGARLMNAAVATGIGADCYASHFDSCWIDLSKGLGCPVGAVLCGSSAFIEEARRWKQRLGGAMRQAGILAAAGSYALDHHVSRLAEDHDNAKQFAQRLSRLPGLSVDVAGVHTNIVLVGLDQRLGSAPDFATNLSAHGVRIGAVGPSTLRAVTHLDVTLEQVVAAADIVESLILRSAGTAAEG